jgi:DNA-binding transcriptional LysR family regulator
MDIEELRTFVEVADAGGVSPAARRLGVSKSIVSRRLARLEADLGVQLLARTTRGAALTEAGTTFRDYAARVCTEIDNAKEMILPAGELCGRLRIAAPLTFGPTHLAPVIAEMGRRHPQLEIYTCYTDRFVDLISEGYDCAIRVGILPDSNLIARRIGPIRASLVASPSYIRENGAPESPDEILGHQAVMQVNEIWQFLDGARKVIIRPQGRFRSDSGTALIPAVVAGLGIACLPDGVIEDHLEAGTLVRIMTRYPLPEAGIFVIRPPGQHPSRKIRVLTEILVECFGSTSQANSA